LTELLLPRSGIGEIRLLAPMLAVLVREGRVLMLFEPPAQLSAEGLEQIGLPAASCLVVRIRPGRGPSTSRGLAPAPGLAAAADLCWALEQALRSGQLGAVLAWPGALARPEWLRRLQLAAQSHEGPAFLLRELAARSRPSPAPLRLALQPVGADLLGVQILKRRGPALAWPLRLALQPVLSERAQARAASLQAPLPGPLQAAGRVDRPADAPALAQSGADRVLQPAGRPSPP
jgi:protein ImuA